MLYFRNRLAVQQIHSKEKSATNPEQFVKTSVQKLKA